MSLVSIPTWSRLSVTTILRWCWSQHCSFHSKLSIFFPCDWPIVPVGTPQSSYNFQQPCQYLIPVDLFCFCFCFCYIFFLQCNMFSRLGGCACWGLKLCCWLLCWYGDLWEMYLFVYHSGNWKRKHSKIYNQDHYPSISHENITWKKCYFSYRLSCQDAASLEK